MKFQIRFFNVIIVCLLTFNFIGCSSDDEPTEPENSSPVVETLVVPKEFSPGEILEFRVLANDTDGDELTFTWEVDGGELHSTTGTKVKWTAPEEGESVKVTVYVDDGISETTKRAKRILNRNFIQPEPAEKPFDPEPDPPLNSIVPGIGAVGFKLGDPFKKVEHLFGKPDNPLGVLRFFSYWEENKGLSGFVDAKFFVDSIFLDRPIKAKTPGNNGIGSKLERVEAELGKAQEVDNIGNGRNNHWYWARESNLLMTQITKLKIFTFLNLTLQHLQEYNYLINNTKD